MFKFSKSMMFLLMTSTDKNYVQTSNFAGPTRNRTWNFRKICGCHDTRLNGFEEYSKIKKRCIWCCYRAIIIYKWVISGTMITVFLKQKKKKKKKNLSKLKLLWRHPIWFSQAPCQQTVSRSIEKKSQKGGTQSLKEKDHQVNKRSVDCAYQKHFYRRIYYEFKHPTLPDLQWYIERNWMQLSPIQFWKVGCLYW